MLHSPLPTVDQVLAAVGAAHPEEVAALDAVSAAFQRGGRDFRPAVAWCLEHLDANYSPAVVRLTREGKPSRRYRRTLGKEAIEIERSTQGHADTYVPVEAFRVAALGLDYVLSEHGRAYVRRLRKGAR